MIPETIFIALLISMFIFLVLTLQFKNQAFGAVTIILLLLLATQLIPSFGGVEYQTGANITQSGGVNVVENTYSSFDSLPLAIMFFLIIIYLGAEMIVFRRDSKRVKEESLEV